MPIALDNQCVASVVALRETKMSSSVMRSSLGYEASKKKSNCLGFPQITQMFSLISQIFSFFAKSASTSAKNLREINATTKAPKV
jgi:hypothetical protein